MCSWVIELQAKRRQRLAAPAMTYIRIKHLAPAAAWQLMMLSLCSGCGHHWLRANRTNTSAAARYIPAGSEAGGCDRSVHARTQAGWWQEFDVM